MERAGWFDFRVEGLSLERLLNMCIQRGIRLRRIKRISARALTGCVIASDMRKLRELAGERGWRLTILKERGAVRLKKLLKQRALLIFGVLIFFSAAYAAVKCVWFIDIRGAGPYTGEVKRILTAHDIRVGRFVFQIDTDALRYTMERELTGLAFVGVSMQGVTITVNCVQARLAKSASAVPGDLVASRDGVIESITVRAGTAQVKPGDVVRRGQVLIRGEERSWAGAVTPIRADADIRARTWYKAEAYISGNLIETTPTGESFTARTLCTPYYSLSLDTPPAYDVFDEFTRTLPIAGPYPVWLKLTEYQRVERTLIKRDESEVRAEAGIAAMRLANEKVEHDAYIVDKWVEYSMINDGGCIATAVLEGIVAISEAAEVPV